ncbi:MAG: divergent PAP2 family protein [Candidatus Saccharimonadales bacterium]
MKSSIGYLLAPVAAFMAAQILKYLLRPAASRTWKDLLRSGNMPSGHSAVVTSLVTVIFVHEGFSGLFAVAATLAMLTIYDALVARRSIGEQGQALIRLIEKSPFAKDPLPRVALGHKPLEVIAGMSLGLVVGLIVAIFIT